MVKVIIVDDEEWVSIGFKMRINLEKLGLELAGTALNGNDAVQLIEKVHPDIVITDIQMPGMDGIMLMDFLHLQYPEITIIVISGYSEFEYARKAIEYNVLNYILKPIDWVEMETILCNSIKSITSGKVRMAEDKELRKKLSERNEIYYDKLFTDLVLKQENEKDNIVETIRTAGYEFTPDTITVMVMRLYNLHKCSDKELEWDSNDFSDKCYSVLKEVIQKENNTLVFKSYVNKNEIIIVKGFCDSEVGGKGFISEGLNEFAVLLQNIVEAQQDVKTSIGIGNNVNIKQLHESYTQAVKAVKFAGFTLSDGIIRYDELSQQTDYSQLPSKNEKEFLFYLENGSHQKVMEIIDEIFVVQGKGVNPQGFKNSILELVMGIGRLMRGYGKLLHEVLESEETYNVIFQECTIDQLKLWFQSVCLSVMEWIANKNKNGGKKIIDEIITYLDNNYNENVNLKAIADKYYFTTAYISKIFKSHTGENFSDYLCRVRIGKAAELLKNPDLKLHDIAELVGYENTNYFLKKFKDYFGYTPSEYRKEKINTI